MRTVVINALADIRLGLDEIHLDILTLVLSNTTLVEVLSDQSRWDLSRQSGQDG